MSGPTVTLAPAGDEWLASLTGIDGLGALSAMASTAEEAAAAVRAQAQAACLLAAAAQGLTVGPLELAALELRLRQACSLALARLTPAPVPAASGFGSDISTFAGPDRNDLHPFLPLITGKRAVAEAVARRLLTPRGLLPWAQGEGFDVRDLLGQGFTPAALQSFSAQISTEAEADERVQSAEVTITFNEPRQALAISVRLRTAEGPFTLVLDVSKLAADITILANP